MASVAELLESVQIVGFLRAPDATVAAAPANPGHFGISRISRISAWSRIRLASHRQFRHPGLVMIKKFANDFKEFAFKGNLIDMAVGIVIGGAFGTVVKSLVDDVFMPVVGRLTGGVNFKDYYLVLKGEVPEGTALEAAKKIDGVNLLTYGNFVTSFISFLILAFVLFLVINKFMAALKKKDAEPTAPPAPSDEAVLLSEIRDLLKNQKP